MDAIGTFATSLQMGTDKPNIMKATTMTTLQIFAERRKYVHLGTKLRVAGASFMQIINELMLLHFTKN
jgi:hypothetical protein